MRPKSPPSLLTTIFMIVLVPALALADKPFVTETVDSPNGVGSYTSLELDGRGVPHIAYWYFTGGDARYARRAGNMWIIEDVETVNNVGSHMSLALDPSGNPHLSYYDSNNDDLRYAVKTGGAWSIELVDATGDVGQATSIDIDNAGNPHISYRDFTNGALKYAFKSGGGWTVESVHVTGAAGDNTSIEVDFVGNPHISYSENADGELLYAVKIEGTWILERVDTLVVTGADTSIELDSNGAPHISYYHVATSDLRYATKASGSWVIETAEGGASPVGQFTSLELDAQDVPHITYNDFIDNDLKYANKIGGSWTLQIVDAPGNVGDFGSMELDQHGNVYVSYFDDANDDLKFAHSAVHLETPVGGETWAVGSVETIEWKGVGAVDISLSVDGGASFNVLATGVEDIDIETGGSYALRVPHTPSRFCVVRIERQSPYAIAEADSFFTIETSVSLLALLVSPPLSGPGLVVTWDTDPGPADLGGYRLERRRPSDDWQTVAPFVQEAFYHDLGGRSGDQYRLFAINGLGEEFYLGETSASPPAASALDAWPVPFSGGDLTIAFPTGTFAGQPSPTEVAIYDALGRLVRTVANGTFTNPIQLSTWDGRDETGSLVSAGVYFIKATSGGTTQTRKIVIVR